VITAIADEFGGDIPAGPFALIGGDEIGRGVVATLTGHPAIMVPMSAGLIARVCAGVTHAFNDASNCLSARPVTSLPDRTWAAHGND